MRKIIFLCALAAFMLGCNPDNKKPEPVKEYVTIGFEEAVLLTNTGGLPYYYDNILWGAELATMNEDLEMLWFDGILYTEDIASFGSFYADYWESYDTWSGFAISNTATMEYNGYEGQFNVAAESATKFAVGYCAPAGGFRNGADYEDPTIILSEPTIFTSAQFANTTVTYSYSSITDLWYTITATGYLNGSETGKVDVKLIENGVAQSGWQEVSLEGLGEVDKIIFTADSNDKNSAGILCPLYFCMDNLKYEVVE